MWENVTQLQPRWAMLGLRNPEQAHARNSMPTERKAWEQTKSEKVSVRPESNDLITEKLEQLVYTVADQETEIR